MFCKHCGKELSDVAPICPNCGTPTGLNNPKTDVHIKKIDNNESQTQIYAIIGFTLSMIGFICMVLICVIVPIFADSVNYSFLSSGYSVLVAPAFAPVISVFGILTALFVVASFITSLVGILKTKNTQQRTHFNLLATGLVFSSFEILLFCFVFFLAPAIIFIG